MSRVLVGACILDISSSSMSKWLKRLPSRKRKKNLPKALVKFPQVGYVSVQWRVCDCKDLLSSDLFGLHKRSQGQTFYLHTNPISRRIQAAWVMCVCNGKLTYLYQYKKLNSCWCSKLKLIWIYVCFPLLFLLMVTLCRDTPGGQAIFFPNLLVGTSLLGCYRLCIFSPLWWIGCTSDFGNQPLVHQG